MADFAEQTFSVVQNDTWEFGATLRDKTTGDPVDLSTAVIIGATASNWGATVIDNLSIGSGITLPGGGTDGRFQVQYDLSLANYPVPAGDNSANFVYDFEVRLGVQKKTRLRGTLQIYPEISP